MVHHVQRFVHLPKATKLACLKISQTAVNIKNMSIRASAPFHGIPYSSLQRFPSASDTSSPQGLPLALHGIEETLSSTLYSTLYETERHYP